MKKLVFIASMCVALFGIDIGKVPPVVSISGDAGGYVEDGAKWSSSMLRDKVYVVFYVDPDEKDKNERFAEALKKRHFSRAKFGSVAIVNTVATWKPNFIIQKILESKQKKYKDTIYVMDKKSVLVDSWGLADDDSDILLFDKDGKLLFYKAGRLSDEEIEQLLRLIEAKINEERV